MRINDLRVPYRDIADLCTCLSKFYRDNILVGPSLVGKQRPEERAW